MAEPQWKIIPELTQEIIDNAIKQFGCTEEDVREQWAETQRLNEQGGGAAVIASIGEVIMDREEVVVAMAEAAEAHIHLHPERNVCLGEYFDEMTGEIDLKQIDSDALLHGLVLACFMLAELKEQVTILMDGNRRDHGTLDKER